MIDGDHHQLCQVFTNLIANAFEALDGKGHIVSHGDAERRSKDPAFAHVHPPTPAVVVEVADDGPGVPQEMTDKIFNPFSRPNRARAVSVWRSSGKSSTRTTGGST